jgi:hypothetical protein
MDQLTIFTYYGNFITDILKDIYSLIDCIYFLYKMITETRNIIINLQFETEENYKEYIEIPFKHWLNGIEECIKLDQDNLSKKNIKLIIKNYYFPKSNEGYSHYILTHMSEHEIINSIMRCFCNFILYKCYQLENNMSPLFMRGNKVGKKVDRNNLLILAQLNYFKIEEKIESQIEESRKIFVKLYKEIEKEYESKNKFDA